MFLAFNIYRSRFAFDAEVTDRSRRFPRGKLSKNNVPLYLCFFKHIKSLLAKCHIAYNARKHKKLELGKRKAYCITELRTQKSKTLMTMHKETL